MRLQTAIKTEYPPTNPPGFDTAEATLPSPDVCSNFD